MSPVSTAEAVAAFLDERRYSEATRKRWLALAESDAAALLSVAQALRPSENQLRDIWSLLIDIAERDSTPLARVVGQAEVQTLLARPAARSETIKALKAKLRELRLPGLVAVERQARNLVAALGLPRAVRLELPTHLEGDQLHVSFSASSVEALAATAQAILEAASRPECAQLFALLEEAP